MAATLKVCSATALHPLANFMTAHGPGGRTRPPGPQTIDTSCFRLVLELGCNLGSSSPGMGRDQHTLTALHYGAQSDQKAIQDMLVLIRSHKHGVVGQPKESNIWWFLTSNHKYGAFGPSGPPCLGCHVQKRTVLCIEILHGLIYKNCMNSGNIVCIYIYVYMFWVMQDFYYQPYSTVFSTVSDGAACK